MRLDRRLVELGLGSRSEVTLLARRGRVTVDGDVVRDGATHVGPAAVISVDGVEVDDPPTLVAWHKPVGVLSTLGDPWGRAHLGTAVPTEAGTGWHPVGRLDLDTSGLLLLSRDGALTQHLLHPRRAIEREYLATVEPAPGPDLAARLAAGVETAAGTFPAELRAVDGAVIRLVVREGKHRMVRRILANVGHPVVALHRVRYGVVTVDGLAEGEVRPVSDEDVAKLRAL
jgi:23S rRNA pseudouridine2605 synthase